MVKRSTPVESAEAKPVATVRPLAGIDMIVNKNLFDPERGASKTREAEADSRVLQRIRSFILLGTAILGSNRYAILQDGGGGSAPAQPGRSPTPSRYKVGDVVEAFSLSEIRDKNIVFSKSASKVELALDYFRKIETSTPARALTPQPGVNTPVPGQPGPMPLVPRVLPQLPRRERLPAPPQP